MIIGVTGLIGSGKGAVADILVRKGFIKLGHSAILDEELRARNIEINRDNQVKIANEMRNQYGHGYWARKLIERIEPGKNYVVEGFRNTAEVEEFKKIPNFLLVGVAAGRKRRYEWISNRQRHGDPKNFEEFLKVEVRDFLEKEAYGQQNAFCFAMADRFVQNEGNLDDLNYQVNRLFEEVSETIVNTDN